MIRKQRIQKGLQKILESIQNYAKIDKHFADDVKIIQNHTK